MNPLDSEVFDWSVKVRLRTRDEAKTLLAELQRDGIKARRFFRRVIVYAESVDHAEEIAAVVSRRHPETTAEIRGD